MLKNYTSTVPASASIAYIERKLVQNGATQILKQYGPKGRLSDIRFCIKIDGQDVLLKLPAQVENCENVLMQNLPQRARPETIKKVPKQAERTAWKILSDWLDAQVAMIELAQVEVLEIFLPYVYNPQTQQTVFQMAKASGYKALLTGEI